VAEVFPGVETRGDLGENTTLLSIDKARRLLGYAPTHEVRDGLAEALPWYLSQRGEMLLPAGLSIPRAARA
jgi:nucleoside-diphosphate-sugar epimerase